MQQNPNKRKRGKILYILIWGYFYVPWKFLIKIFIEWQWHKQKCLPYLEALRIIKCFFNTKICSKKGINITWRAYRYNLHQSTSHPKQGAFDGRRSEINICRKLISNNNHFKERTCLWMQLCVAAFGILDAGSLSPLPMLTDKCSKALGRILTNPRFVYVLEIRMPKLYLLILSPSELQQGGGTTILAVWLLLVLREQLECRN